MNPKINPLAGQPAPAASLVDVPRLVTAYYSGTPDPGIAAQRVAFGTSGHRGSSFDLSFNERHVLSISQAIAEYRRQRGINGPLFIGFDTHALSAPAFASALEVLAANGVEIMISAGDEYHRRLRPCRTPSSRIIAAANPVSRTASSSLSSTNLPTTAASSTTRRMADPPIPM